MYSRFVLIAVSFLHTTLAIEYLPFSTPINPRSSAYDFIDTNLFRRADRCATSCSKMGFDLCCAKSAVCALDQAGSLACCPKNSVCTGTIAAAEAAAPTAPPLAGSSVAAPGAGITHAISGTSTISNQYYPFPVLPTTYANAIDCTTSFSACQAESAKCTGFIEGGGGYGVTISGQGGQITQQAVIPASSAESICSSLSLEACHGLQLAQCSTLGGPRAMSAGGSFVAGGSSNAGAMPTRCGVWYGMGVGVAVGLAGQVVG